MGDIIRFKEIETEARRGSFVRSYMMRTWQNRDHGPSLFDAGAHARSALPAPRCCLLIPNELEPLNRKFFLSLIKHPFLTVLGSKGKGSVIDF